MPLCAAPGRAAPRREEAEEAEGQRRVPELRGHGGAQRGGRWAAGGGRGAPRRHRAGGARPAGGAGLRPTAGGEGGRPGGRGP